MNEAEWSVFVLEVEHGFKGEGWSDEAEAVSRGFLADLPYETAHAALALLVADGAPFTPYAADIMAAAKRLAGRTAEDAPPFEEAWRCIVLLVLPVCRGGTTLDRAVKAVAEHVGEGAARWVQARGPELMLEQVEGEYRGAVRHRLAQEYQRYVDQAAEDGKRGLALERAERETLALPASGEPRRLSNVVRLPRQLGAGP